MKIALFVGSLGTGGAQRQFVQLANALARRHHQVTMIASTPEGQYWDWLSRCQGPTRLRALYPTAMRAGKLSTVTRLALSPLHLRSILREMEAEILYTALYLSNVIGWRAAQPLGIPVVWGIRASAQDLNWKRSIPYRLCKHLSPSIPLTIANSAAGLEDHQARGFRFQRHTVIPNGIDTSAFYPDAVARQRQRTAWGVAGSTRLIGLPGRLAPKKGHAVFLKAAARLAGRYPDLRFVLIGDGPANYGLELKKLAQELALGDRIIWAGACDDMHAAYNALDVACAPSLYGEGFPNVVAEAMACEVPCVASDVGDTASIMGDDGLIIPPDDPAALEMRLEQLLAADPTCRWQQGRKRIVERFSVEALAARTEQELAALLKH